MTLRQPKDGRPTGVKGVISTQKLRDALGVSSKPREIKVKDSPRQARLRSEGRDKEADALASDDYSAGVLEPSEIYEAFGKPTLTDPNVPDGHPQPIPPPPSEAARQARRSESAAMNAPSPEESAAEIRRDAAEQAAQLAGMAKQHAAKQMTRAKQVQQSGTPAEKSAVAEDITRSNTVLGAVKKLLGGGA